MNALIAIGGCAIVCAALVVALRRARAPQSGVSPAEVARYESAVSTARAAFADAMREVDALDERDPELGSEARLAIAVIVKKIEEIERDVAREPRMRAHALVVDRLTRMATELTRTARELKEARPKKTLHVLT